MPIDDERHDEILDALIEELGEDYVFDDPAVVECYRREGQSPSYTTPMNPEFVVLPENTEDIQKIVRLANRLDFPYSVSSTGTLGAYAAALKSHWCWIDPKRMNELHIDEKNMYAVVEPYVSHAQVSVEARKKGLYNANPSAGGQTSCLANHVALGTQTSGYRTGRANRNILGLEMVLPDGEILRTGTLAMGQDEFFWGEGPGPDLRGFVRSHLGHLGALGIVTKVAVKLFPWPGPAMLPTEGVAPQKKCVLPDDRFRWHLIRYDTTLEGIEGLRAISKAEIGSVVALFGPWNMSHHYSTSREEHWKLWDEGWFHRFGYCVLVGIWGVTSEKQVDYEEKVLEILVEKTGGKPVDKELTDKWIPHVAARNVIDPLASRAQRIPTGIPPAQGGGIVYDSLSDGKRLIPDHDDLAAWIVPIDLGHFAMHAVFAAPGAGDKSKEAEEAMKAWQMAAFPKILKEQVAEAGVIGGPLHMVAPAFGSCQHTMAEKIKKALDPKNVANPGRFINVEAMEAARKAAAEKAQQEKENA